MEELNCDTVFTIPVLGGINVSESIVVTWIIIGLIAVCSRLFTRRLSVLQPVKSQIMLESIIDGIQNFFYGILGQKGKQYIPYLCSIAIYLGISNLIGLIGWKPPTKDLSVTIALSIMSIILIQYAGIQEKGVRKWIKGFAEPIPIIAPINVLELVIKPLSLCMRLFGNIIGSFVVMELIRIIAPLIIPIPFSLYFDIFDGLIQAYVFVFLTSLFINEVVE